MASFKYFLKFKLPKNKRRPGTIGRVVLLYTHDSLTCEFSTGQTTEPKYWDDEKGKYKKHENAISLNKVLDKFKEKVEQVVTDLKGKDIYPSPSKVKEEYEKAKTAKLPEQIVISSMNYLWKAYLDYLKNTTSKVTGEKRTLATINSNRNSQEAFERFIKKNKIEAIQPAGFNISKFHKWEEFLQSEYPSGNSRSKRQKHFKAACKHFKKIGYPVGFDLDEVSYKEKAGHKIHIDEQELLVIEKHPLVGRMDLIRDLILIGCNVGLRISDFKRLHKNIQGDDIVIQAKKTSEPLKIPIVPKVKALLLKYGNDLPVIPEPVFRREVKELFKEIFPDKTVQVKVNGEFITAHKSEFITLHSFIRTLVYLLDKRGVSVPQIAKVTGKSVHVLLKHYLNVSQDDANKSMREAMSKESPLKIAN